MNGQPESEKPKERYAASYLAMDAAHQKPVAVPRARRRSGGWIKVALLLLLIGGAVAYFQRAHLIPWLEQNPQTAVVLQAVREKLGLAGERESDGPSSVGNGALPTGGETTFTSGQGFGTVAPDDGSDTFRVVVPPGETSR